MIQALKNIMALPDIRRRVLFTLWMLIVYRLFAQIPVLKLDQAQLNELLADNLVVGFVDLLAGGGMLTSFSIVATGVFPYVMATVIVHALTPLVPRLEEIAREGEAGRAKIQRYIHLLTIPIALVLALRLSIFLDRQIGLFPDGVRLVTWPTLLRSLAVMTTVVAGSMLSVWFASLITEHGIGQGHSMIVLCGACIFLFKWAIRAVTTQSDWLDPKPLSLAMLVLVPVICVVGMIFLLEGRRRIPVQYGPRVRGRKIYGGQATDIPLRVLPSPDLLLPIYTANGILLLTGLTGASFSSVFPRGWLNKLGEGMTNLTDPLGYSYWIALFFGTIIFSYLYATVNLKEMNLAESLRRQGGFIPRVRPGLRTQEYIEAIHRRVTPPSAVGLAVLVTALPNLLRSCLVSCKRRKSDSP